MRCGTGAHIMGDSKMAPTLAPVLAPIMAFTNESLTKTQSRSLASLEKSSSRVFLYSFPWRRRSTASHILNHLKIRRRFRCRHCTMV